MTAARHFTLSPVHIPASVESPDAADFIAASAIGDAVEVDSYGTDELNFSAAERLPRWHDTHKRHWFHAAWLGGRMVGRGSMEALLEEPDTCWLDVRVLPEARRLGIGTALADTLEAAAAADGRTKAIAYVFSARGSGDQVRPPTGFGSVAADNPEVRFLLHRGYTLEQVERGSRLALPVDVAGLAVRLAAVTAVTGPDYRLHQWSGPVPERRRADMAVLYTATSTEEPSAGLEEPESIWTIERVLESEQLAAHDGRTSVVTVAEHVATGRLCGFTTLSVPAETSRAVAQDDTLVMPGHRGHRLGTLMKIANLVRLQRDHPGHPAIITFNAEENRPMLDVNEVVGFVPMGSEGAWRKTLVPAARFPVAQ